MSKENLLKRILFNNKTVALLGLLIIAAISVPLYENIIKRYAINQEISGLQKEITSLEAKNSKLNQMIDYLESDQFVEEQARMNLNLKKEGENVVVIQNQAKDQNENNSQKTSDNKEKLIYNIPGLEKAHPKIVSNPEKWFKYFFD